MPINTPILFLVFNRPDTTARVFEAIAKQQPKYLFIAADGPRLNKNGEAELCQKVREITSNITWPCEVKTLYRNENLGCKIAVSSAINWFFSEVEEGIILEDDCLPHPDFFVFCEALLHRYRNNNKVMHIGGSNFQFGIKREYGSYYYSAYAHIWGWATWRRAWKNYDVNFNPQDFDALLKQRFKRKLEQTYWKNILTKLQNNTLNTWDYQWTFSIWNKNGLCIVPNQNLVTNIGAGKDATHLTGTDNKFVNLKTGSILPLIFNDTFKINKAADAYTAKHMFVPPVYKIILYKLKQLIK